MITFKDMTFCESYDTCKDGKDCHRSLTKKVQDDANKWWGQDQGAPICVFSGKPDCYEEITHAEI